MSTSSPSPSSTDAAFNAILKQYTSTGIGGELRFTDAFFSFLRRHTSLLNVTQSVEQVQKMAMKHVDIARQEKQDKKKPTTTAATTTSTQAAASPAPSVSSSSAESKTSNSTSVSSSTEEKKQEESESESAESKDKDKDKDKGPAPVNNGGVTDRYSWGQTLGDVTVTIPNLPPSTTARQLDISITSTHLSVINKATKTTLIASQSFHDAVHADDATWTLEPDTASNTKQLVLYLPKVNRMNWWSCVLQGDPQIDVTRINPEQSQLSDLDSSTRQTVEKMMFDQRQKAAGGKTSDELQKEQALKKFMAMHPEMDFSQAKIM